MHYEKHGPEVVEELYAQFGAPRQPRETDLLDENDKGELPEMAFYRSHDEFITAAAEFSVYPESDEVQEKFVEAREDLRGKFRVLVARTLESPELDDNLKRTQLISFAMKDKDEDRTTAFNRLFPDGLFTTMPLDHDRLVTRVGSLVIERGDTTSGRLSIVDELVEEFTKLVSRDVRKAHEAALSEDDTDADTQEEANFEDPQEDITEYIIPEEVVEELPVAREWEQ